MIPRVQAVLSHTSGTARHWRGHIYIHTESAYRQRVRVAWHKVPMDRRLTITLPEQTVRMLDLEVLAPRRPLPPLGDVVQGDHASTSTPAFTNSRQSFERTAPPTPELGRSFV